MHQPVTASDLQALSAQAVNGKMPMFISCGSGDVNPKENLGFFRGNKLKYVHNLNLMSSVMHQGASGTVSNAALFFWERLSFAIT